MKSGTSFFLGFIIGAAVCFGVLYIFGFRQTSAGERSERLVMFKEPRGEVNYALFNESIFATGCKVIQVMSDRSALALPSVHGVPIPDQAVLLLPLKAGCYYDGQVVPIPEDKVMRQIGIYRYQNKEGLMKTVPVVKFYPKK